MPARPPLVVLALAALTVPTLAGCGKSSFVCSGDVCTVQSNQAGSFDLDQLGTKVTLSDLTHGSVRVGINADSATVRRGQQVRLRGFLVSAPETDPERVKVRIQR